MQGGHDDNFTLFGGRRGTRSAAPIPKGPLVRIVVERGIDDPGTADGLTYRALDENIHIGDRVVVPLGKAGRPTGGIVVDVETDEAPDNARPAYRIKPVLERSDSRLPAPLLDLARWMAGYYASPLGMVLATMVPAAVKHQTGRRIVRLVGVGSLDEPARQAVLNGLRPTARRAWDQVAALHASTFPIAAKELASRLEHKTLAQINALLRAGLLIPVEQATIRSAEAFWKDGQPASDPAPTLTPDQARCIDGIAACFGTFGVHLLRGVTGSGKTEVYLRLIDRLLPTGKSALVLVPEIALTPQTVGRFERRFGEVGVAVLHSGLSASQRHRQWMLAASGRAPIVVGARSAIFAPIRNLGIVIVDEEHDHSYKQDQAPRYNGRDVAIKRGQIERCPVVLGSATPSLESWHNARSGKARLWELPNRVGGGALPPVDIVDLLTENRLRAMATKKSESRELHAIGPTLESGIDRTLGEGGQVILLLNRRGFANYICCPSRACGWMLSCDQCDAGMVLHRDNRLPRGGVVVCHHCRSEQRIPAVCPSCGRPPLPLGVGTQRVEEELLAKFGRSQGLELRTTMLRVDSDTMRSGRDYFEALASFERGQVRLMLGTQMIAKGLDFPNVRLVGVVNADTAVFMPDFRAWERTFQLVSQVAGRAGRGIHPGRVIVQTACADNRAIRLAANHDYTTFADEELKMRELAGRPPATRMARIVCRDEDDAKARDAADRIADAARKLASPSVEIVGPMPCTLARLHNQYRFAVEFTAPRASDIQRILHELRARRLVVGDAATAVDVDPLSFM
ncbi:MAG: primosomal protein N' [Phycisphaerales bacterium]|nr:primosomal protein N' [Phycisphaerales bacterium]